MQFTLFVDGYFCNPYDATCVVALEEKLSHADLALTLMRLVRTDIPLSTAAQHVLGANLARPSVKAYVEHPRPPHPPP